MSQIFATKMVQYYITPYEDGYCFVHDSGRAGKYIFSQEKAAHIHSKAAKLFRVDASYFEMVYTNGKVERFPYIYLFPEQQIIGTTYRSMGKISEHDVHVPTS